MSTATAELPADSLVGATAPSIRTTAYRFAPVVLALVVFGVASAIATPYPVGIFHEIGRAHV